MKHVSALVFFLFVLLSFLSAQENGSRFLLNKKSEETPFSDPAGRLTTLFNRTECGLDYVAVSVKLTNRTDLFQSVNNNLLIAGLPVSSGLQVLHAYLYWVVEGGTPGLNNRMKLITPISSETLFGTEIGRQSAGKCWACSTSQAMHFRADITHLVCASDPSGVYNLSEYPSKWQACNPTPGGCICREGDTDGATLIIIYKDHNAVFNGSLRLDDGLLYSELGQTLSFEMKDTDFCAVPVQSSVTFALSDFQQFGNWQTNRVRIGNRVTPIVPRFYNQERITLPLAQNNDLKIDILAENGDCYTLVWAAAYGRTPNCPARCLPNPNPPISTVGILPSMSFCAGAPLPILKYTGFPGEIIKWQMTSDCQTGIWTDIDTTADEFRPPDLSENACFRVVSKAGSCLQYSPVARLTLSERVNPGTTNGSGAFCETADNVRLTLSERTGEVQFWQTATDPDCKNWTEIPARTFSYTVRNLTRTACFRAGIRFSNCDLTFSEPARLVVTPSDYRARVAGTNAVCGSQRNAILTVENLDDADVLYWESSFACDSAGSDWVKIKNPVPELTINNLSRKTCFRAVLKAGNCPPKPTPLHSLEITENTVAGTVSESQTVCNTEQSAFLTLTGYVGKVIRWESFSVGNENQVTTLNHTLDRLPVTGLTRSTGFRAVVRAGNCPELTSQSATFTFREGLEKGTLSASQTLCPEIAPLPLRLTGYKGTIARWEKSTDGENWLNTGNAGTDVFTPSPLTRTENYRAVLTLPGCDPIFTDVVTLTLRPGAEAGTLSAGQTVCEFLPEALLILSGYSGTVKGLWSRTETGPFLPYQLRSQAEFNIENIRENTYFRAEVSHPECGSVFTEPVLIGIDKPPVGGNLPPLTELCADGILYHLNLKDHSGNIRSWEFSSDSLQWFPIPNSTNEMLTLRADVPSVRYYRVNIGRGVCESVYSSAGKVVLRSGTLPGVLSRDTVACADSIFIRLSLTGFRGDILFWEKNESPNNNWEQIPFKNSEYRTYVNKSGKYRVRVQNGSCPGFYSNEINVRLLPPVKGGTLTGGGTFCESDPIPPLKLSGYSGQILGWEVSKDNGTVWHPLGKTGETDLTPYRLTVPTRFRVLVENGDCGQAFSTEAEIKIDRPTLGGQVTGGGTFCRLSDSDGLNLIQHRGNILFWEHSPDNGQTWNSLAHFAAFLPPSLIKSDGLYRAAVKNGSCRPVYSLPAKVVLLKASSGGQVSGASFVCRGGTSGKLFLKNYIGNVLQWERSDDKGLNWQFIAHPFDVYESEPVFGTVSFRALVKNGDCEATYSSVHLIELTDRLWGGSLISSEVLCSFTDSTTLTLSRYLGAIAHWERSDDNGVTFNSFNHFESQFRTGSLTGRVDFRVKLESGICPVMYSPVISLSPQPPPVLNAQARLTCEGKGEITASVSGGSGQYLNFVLSRNGAVIRTQAIGRNVFSIAIPDPGYVLTVKDANGCQDAQAIVFPSEPETPEITDFPFVTVRQAGVRWERVSGTGVRYYVRYRVNGSESYELSPLTTGNALVLSNLQHQTEYEVQVFALCGTDTLKSKTLRYFRTPASGNCAGSNPSPPGGFMVSFVTPTSARLSWNLPVNDPQVEGYIISYAPDPTPFDGRIQTVVCHPQDHLTLTNLLPGTRYRAQIRTNCSNCTTALKNTDKRSVWSQNVVFLTPHSRNEETFFHSEGWKVFPNPASENLYIYINKTKGYSLTVFDPNGKIVFELENPEVENVISVSDWRAGLYAVRLQTPAGMKTERVLIIR